jgi:cell division protein FtsL
MKSLDQRIKSIIYWIGLGISLVVYAHANFSTTKQVEKLEAKIERQATSSDIARLEGKIDTLTIYLLERK